MNGFGDIIGEGQDVFVRLAASNTTQTQGHKVCLGVAVDITSCDILVRFGDGREMLCPLHDVRPLGRGHELENPALCPLQRLKVDEHHHQSGLEPSAKKAKLQTPQSNGTPSRPPIILSIRAVNSEADSGKKVKKKVKTLTSSTSPLSEAKAAEAKAAEAKANSSGGSPSPLKKAKLRPRRRVSSDGADGASSFKKTDSEFDYVNKKPPDHVLQARKSLPYQFDSLLWDDNHQRNDKERYCYCGESGDWYRKMLQCDRCCQWFHQECIRSKSDSLPPQLLLGDRFFEFVCILCNDAKCTEETVVRKDLNWVDALHLAIFNLTVSNNNKYHDVATSIIPFVKRRWKDLQGPGARLKHSRMSVDFVVSVLKSHKSRFRCGSAAAAADPHNPMAAESNSGDGGHFWGLRKVAPPSLKGNQQSMTVDLKKLRKGSAAAVSGTNLKAKGSSEDPRRPLMKYPGNPVSQPNKGTQPATKNKKRLNGSKKPRIDSLDSAFEDFANKTSLDLLIPPPKNYFGFNNPFRDYFGPPVLIPEVFPEGEGKEAPRSATCPHRQSLTTGQHSNPVSLLSSKRYSRRFFTAHRRDSASSSSDLASFCGKCSTVGTGLSGAASTSSKTDSGFTTSPERSGAGEESEHESVASSSHGGMAGIGSCIDDVMLTSSSCPMQQPPPLLDCSLSPMSTPLHHRSTDTPPTLDLFLHPSDFKQAPNTTISTSTAAANTLPISSKDLNKFSFCSSSSSRISSTASQILTARRLTPDGDIQYLVTTAPS